MKGTPRVGNHRGGGEIDGRFPSSRCLGVVVVGRLLFLGPEGAGLGGILEGKACSRCGPTFCSSLACYRRRSRPVAKKEV